MTPEETQQQQQKTRGLNADASVFQPGAGFFANGYATSTSNPCQGQQSTYGQPGYWVYPPGPQGPYQHQVPTSSGAAGYGYPPGSGPTAPGDWSRITQQQQRPLSQPPVSYSNTQQQQNVFTPQQNDVRVVNTDPTTSGISSQPVQLKPMKQCDAVSESSSSGMASSGTTYAMPTVQPAPSVAAKTTTLQDHVVPSDSTTVSRGGPSDKAPAPLTTSFLEQVNGESDWDAEEEDSDSVNQAPGSATAAPSKVVPEVETAVAEKVEESMKKVTSTLKKPDPRPHLNVVFIGHVDAGKSTTCGNILVLTGEVDPRMLEKYEREAKEKNRETWYYAFIVDINEEERQKGKTVEVGRAGFQLEKNRFTILDAPGHKGFVPNMISGAAQADVAVLIISARKGEFETGFEKGGQTREHAMLAKTLGVSQLIVAVNKMDDPTCCWSEDRYREIERKLIPYLRNCGYNPAKDITFIPISGLSGENIKVHVTDPSFASSKLASWYDKSKPTLLEILNNLTPPERNAEAALRIPLLEGFRDQGVSLVGKVESGTVVTGQSAILMPKKLKVKITSVSISDEDVAYAKPGENVLLRVTGVEEDQVTKGLVLCSLDSCCPVATRFIAQVMVVELLEHRPLLTAGYCCVFHSHTVSEECQIVKLHEVVDKATKRKKLNPLFVKGNSMVVCEIQVAQSVCLETFAKLPQLGRFTLRDESKTIVIGKVLEILE